MSNFIPALISYTATSMMSHVISNRELSCQEVFTSAELTVLVLNIRLAI